MTQDPKGELIQQDFNFSDDIPVKCEKCGAVVSLEEITLDGCYDCLPFDKNAKIYPALEKDNATD